MENKKKTLKILAASDLHGDTSQIKKLALQAEEEKVDLVILCGDLTSPNPTNNIIKPFTDRGKKVLIVPGNHDGFALGDFLADLYPIRNLHGTSTQYYNIGFFGCGGANVGLEALSDEEAFDTLRKGFYNVKQTSKKIMVTHVHPSGTIVDKIIPHAGSKGVKKAIDLFKPDLLLCGHIHEAAGMEDMIGTTRVINVGKQGKILELELN